MKLRWYMGIFAAVLLVLCGLSPAFCQDVHDTSPPPEAVLTLAKAVMCEGIKDYQPENPAAVFSIRIKKVSCFTSFDPVPEKTYIYQKWLHKDRISTKIKLYLQPPRWSTFSTIQLREADKGPWRVEITDPEGRLFDTVRFSITD